jgi:hypothetical protein
MEDLAEAVDGNTAHYYGLMLEDHFRRLPTGFTQVPPAVSHSAMPQF